MASYLQIENISKSYGPKVLFDRIGFNVNEGDKIALIAPNGTGKTSLMRILAGKDKSDSGGQIKFLKDIRIAFLEQEYDYDPDATLLEQILSGSGRFTEGLDEAGHFEYERRIVRLLTELSLRPEQKMKELSGGEIKRVAIAEVLATEAEFLIMDEPTNHLDIDAIEYLENYLKRSRCTLFMVTHDRYFLDRVCNTVMELDHGQIYVYKGDYENFLEKREERIANYNAQTDRVRNLLRRELEWMHATPCARTGKAKYRKQAFWDLKDRAEQAYVTRQVSLESLESTTRLGTKIIDCHDVSFRFPDAADGTPGACIVDGFSYKFQRYDRIGIVGANGIGKTTFINLLLGNLQPTGGTIELGASLKIGYYSQQGMEFDEDQTVLDTVPNTSLLNQFLFPHDMLNNPVYKLSGGEKRRLYLLTILMQQPNMLILDEPTNDLDIVTLNILEEYLLDFKGSLLTVTHDRHFLDRIADHLLVFCGDGVIKDFVGGYTEYRSFIKDYEAGQRRAQAEPQTKVKAKPKESEPGVKKKLSFKEQRELTMLETEMEQLNEEKTALEEALSEGTLPYDKIVEASARYETVKKLLDEKESRWLELSL
ncbi:MAG: ABC-F family ATP-binding cassette domain-containing protein [Bacteroidales bacterium]|nr:ABC-F family ATP-binding cassette domain-containing protein [Bacteroidales bacterium]